MSTVYALACSPSSFAAASNLSSLRSNMATDAPSLMNLLAVARPMPSAAPVTIKHFFQSGVLSLLCPDTFLIRCKCAANIYFMRTYSALIFAVLRVFEKRSGVYLF